MPMFRSPRARFSLLALLPVATLMILSGCAGKIVPPCPPVRVDNATASLTKFKDGPGRETNDIEYRAEIAGYKGQCTYDKKGTEVEVTMDVDFTVTGGPAAKGGTAPIYYFVAIPQFFPQVEGKRITQVTRRLPARSGAVDKFTESSVRVVIPLKKDQPGATFDVYLGFQVDDAQLEYNRSQRN